MKIAIMGYGTIGSGVAEVLEVNQELLADRAGEALEVKYILDLRDFPGDKNEDKLIKDFKNYFNEFLSMIKSIITNFRKKAVK